MAARFWVGDSANLIWDDAGNWSATSGGAGGAGIPTAADDVTFDALSGLISGDNITKSVGPIVCKDFKIVGGVGVPFDVSAGPMTISGSLENFNLSHTNMPISVILDSSAGAETLRTNNLEFFDLLIDGSSIFTIAAAHNLTFDVSGFASILKLREGTLDFGGTSQIVTVSQVSLSPDASDLTRMLDLGNSQWILNAGATMWDRDPLDVNITVSKIFGQKITLNCPVGGTIFGGGGDAFQDITVNGAAGGVVHRFRDATFIDGTLEIINGPITVGFEANLAHTIDTADWGATSGTAITLNRYLGSGSDQWDISVVTFAAINHVKLQDSNNVAGPDDVPNGTDLGNNTDWTFITTSPRSVVIRNTSQYLAKREVLSRNVSRYQSSVSSIGRNVSIYRLAVSELARNISDYISFRRFVTYRNTSSYKSSQAALARNTGRYRGTPNVVMSRNTSQAFYRANVLARNTSKYSLRAQVLARNTSTYNVRLAVLGRNVSIYKSAESVLARNTSQYRLKAEVLARNESEIHIEQGWEVLLDDVVVGFIDLASGAPFDLSGVAMATGRHVIRIKPADLFWKPDIPEAIWVGEVDGAGALLPAVPDDIQSLRNIIIEQPAATENVEIIWTYQTRTGAVDPDEFAIWIDTTTPVAVGGAPDAVVEFQGDGAYHVFLTLPADRYVAVRARTDTLDGPVAETFVDLADTVPDPPAVQYAEPIPDHEFT